MKRFPILLGAQVGIAALLQHGLIMERLAADIPHESNGTKRKHQPKRGRIAPHQGARECERRRRQMARIAAKREGAGQ